MDIVGQKSGTKSFRGSALKLYGRRYVSYVVVDRYPSGHLDNARAVSYHDIVYHSFDYAFCGGFGAWLGANRSTVSCMVVVGGFVFHQNRIVVGFRPWGLQA